MNSSRLWVAVGGILIIAVLGLTYLLGVSPLLTQAAGADTERAAADAQNAAQLALLAQMKDEFARLPELQKELDELRVSMPPHQNLDDFYDQVAAIGSTAGVVVTKIDTPAVTPFGAAAEGEAPATDGSTPAPVAPAAEAVNSTNAFTIPVSIVVRGTPDQVLDFTRGLQLGARLFLVTNVEFDAAAGTATVSGFIFVIYDESVPLVPEPTEAPTPTTSPAPTPSPTPTEESEG